MSKKAENCFQTLPNYSDLCKKIIERVITLISHYEWISNEITIGLHRLVMPEQGLSPLGVRRACETPARADRVPLRVALGAQSVSVETPTVVVTAAPH